MMEHWKTQETGIYSFPMSSSIKVKKSLLGKSSLHEVILMYGEIMPPKWLFIAWFLDF